MTNEQIRAMIRYLETDKALYGRAVDTANAHRQPMNAQAAEICRSMTATMIDMWKAALIEEPRP